LVVSLLCAAIFIAGAYPHSNLVNKLLPTETDNQTNTRANAPNQNQEPMPNKSTTKTDLEAIQANSQALQIHLEKALARIEQNIQKNRKLMERISRSPRAIQTIQALEVAIAIFRPNKR
jgi:hypothetical protein